MFSVPVGERSEFKVIDMGADVALVLHGHMDDESTIDAFVRELGGVDSYAAIYRMTTGSSEVPETILALDTKYGTPPEIDATPSPGGEDPSAGPAALPGLEPEATEFRDHAVPSADSWWDWVGDCSWFRGISAICGVTGSWTVTSVTWADSGNIQAEWHKGVLMAAGHTYGSDIKAQQWNGSSWTTLFSAYVEPRHYYTLIYGTHNSGIKWRRFENIGRGGGSARTHTAIAWEYDVPPPSSIGTICQPLLAACTTPQG